MALPFITAQEAAELIKDGDSLGLSGFTASGTPKVVTEALAIKAEKEHAEGRPFKVNIFTGASTNDHVDGALARANAINIRTPYQSNPDLRKRLNAHDAHYFDLHLSELAQKLRYGTYGDIDVAIIEDNEVTENGEIVLGTGIGMTPTVAMLAKKIIIEVNDQIPATIRGLHDVYIPNDPPYRREIPIYKANDRIGSPILKVDPSKIVGVVKTSLKDGVHGFAPLDDVTMQIGANVCDFLIGELKRGAIPASFLPLQSGVGNIANAVLFGLGESKDIPAFDMYTEVIQDAVVDLMEKGKCRFASTCSMTFSDSKMDEVFNNIEFFRD
ncbi:MAG: acetyl-CoA hydrolase, partial [Muribaculaceae bacterium]|nr:acetyl-CoA hydrolase [Muribaculaceae bacterium]